MPTWGSLNEVSGNADEAMEATFAAGGTDPPATMAHHHPVSQSQPSPVASREPIASNDDSNVNDNSGSEVSYATPPTTFTRVDGKGLWRSWKRNFKNKLLALLDLIDNSLDAAIVANHGIEGEDESDEEEDDLSDFIGRVHIYPDEVQTGTAGMLNNVMEGANDNNGGITSRHFNNPLAVGSAPDMVLSGETTKTGLCIVNNSVRPVRPLVRVLEVYNSSKIDSGAGDIGENGVGLKQGCATLSDLSFVLVKNGTEGFVELGLIAESLQRAEGCYLPAFRFKIDYEGDTILSLKNQMTNLFSQQKHVNVAKCIERYGSVMGGNASYLEKGIDRLCNHFDSILNFFNNRYVFAVIMDNMSYGNPNDKARGAADPIKDLREAIPRTYLHIPFNFDFRIGNSRSSREQLSFHYWPNRLVEFSSFSVDVNKSEPWWSGIPGYKLRVFVGFDRFRINKQEAEKSCSLYIYSRESGRLIKHEPDGRHLLSLNASGSMYCSGLTVLIDDIEGQLPLNPTKQDIAFGEEAHGDVHKKNLFTWVGSITKFFYEYHLAKFDKKKMELTKKIKQFGNGSVERDLKVVDRCILTSFRLQYKFYARISIRIEQKSAEECPGPDTHFHLIANPPPARKNLSGNKRSRSDNEQHPTSHAASSVNNIHTQQQIANQSSAATHANGVASNYHHAVAQQQVHTGQASWPGNPQQHNHHYRQQANFQPPPYAHVPPQVAHVQHHRQSVQPHVNHLVQQAVHPVRQEQQQPASRDAVPGLEQRNHSHIHNVIDEGIARLVEEKRTSAITDTRREVSAETPGDNAPCKVEGSEDKKQDVEVIDLSLIDDEEEEDTTTPPDAPVVNGTEAPKQNINVREDTDNAGEVGTDPVDNEDDNASAASTKDFYRDLCEKLTDKLEERKKIDHQLKKENRRLKEEISELKNEVERQRQLLDHVSVEEE